MNRKTILSGMVLALSLGGTALAQQPQGPGGPPPGGMRGGPGGPGMMEGMLFQGITLSDAQKTQLQQIRSADSVKMEAGRAMMRAQVDSAFAARQRGDSAAANAIMARGRTMMMQHFEQQTAAVRAILTADQRPQFDKNVADMKTRMHERMQRGPGGPPGDGHDHPAMGPRGAAGRALLNGIALSDAQRTQLRQLQDSSWKAMQQQRAQRVAAVRNLLTPDQRAQFDQNLANLRTRHSHRFHRGWRGYWRGYWRNG